MADGNRITDWIKAGEIAKKHGREPFFGVGIQTRLDNGTFIVVIFNKLDEKGLKGGLPATQADIDKLKELGVIVADKGGWLDE